MQAVILAGGRGTRLRPLTLARPKPLLPVANRAIIDRVLDRVPRGVDRVIIAANYGIDQMRAHFRGADRPFEVLVVDEPEPLGTGGAIKNAEGHLDGATLVLNGDSLDSLDVARFVERHRSHGGLATISLWRTDEPEHFGIAELEGDRIARFVEKPRREEARSDLANAGTYLLEPEVLDLIPPGRFVSLEREVFPLLVPTPRGMFGERFRGFWIDCGRPDTFLEANRVLAKGKPLVAAGVDAKGSRIAPWGVVGPGCRLGPGSVIDGSVLMEEVTLGKGAAVRASVLGRGATVGDGAEIAGSYIGDAARVRPGAKVSGANVEPGKVV